MSKLNTRKAASILLLLAIVLSSLPLLTGSAQSSELITVSGVVMDENNIALKNKATVTIVNVHTGAKQVKKEISKEFEFDVPEGTYMVSAVAENHINYETNGTKWIEVRADDEKSQSVTLKLRKVPSKESEKITINGIILRGIDVILEGAKVQFRATDGKYKGYTGSAYSNETGNYSIKLFPGNFHMVVSAEDYRNYETNISFTTDTTLVNITLNSQPGDEDLISVWLQNDDNEYLTDGIAIVYDKNQDIIYRTGEQSSNQEFYLYRPGNFWLIADAPGYKPNFDYKDISLTDAKPKLGINPLTLDEDTEEIIETTVDFGNDLNSTTISTKWTLNSDSKFPGLDNSDIGNLRFQIDFEQSLWQGDHDGVVDGDEYDSFISKYLKERGPYHVTTMDFLTINNSYYLPTGSAFSYTPKNIKNLGIGDSQVMTIDTSKSYALENGLTKDSMKLDIGKLRDNEFLNVKIPKTFEIADWSPSDADVELVNFHEMTVRESGGVILTVNRVEGPIARIDVTGDYVKSDENIHFDGNKSEDISGRGIQNWSWDFDDGKDNRYGPELDYTFDLPGEYNVTLTVTDSSDQTETAYHIVRVDDAEPTPKFKLTYSDTEDVPMENGMYMIDEDKTVFFNATMSEDTLTGSAVTKIELDLNLPGTFQWDFGDGKDPDHGPEVTHTYKFFEWGELKDNPVLTISLNVTDKAGNWDILDQEIKIKDKTNPVPYISTATSIDVGEEFTWDGSGSTDNFDIAKNLTYKWTFIEPDGNTSGTGINVTKTYTKPGSYTAELNVTDRAGNSWMTRSTPLTVRGVNLAITNIHFDKNVINEGDKLNIRVNVTNTQFGQISGAEATDITVTLSVDGKPIGSKTLGVLSFNTFSELNFTWESKDGDGGKTHNIKANVTLANTAWELSWDDNERERKIDVEESTTNTPRNIAAALIIIVIIVFLLIFLRRRGKIGGGSKRGRRKKDKGDKKKGRKSKK